MAKKKKQVKKRHSRRKSTAQKRRQRRWILLGFLLLAFLGTGLYLRDSIAFYYHRYLAPFEHKKLENPIKEKQRIDRIILEHRDKTFGIDLSHYQNPKDFLWDSLYVGDGALPIEFIVLRASMGGNRQDQHFASFWEKAQEKELIRGAYHFYSPDEDPILQVNNFLAIAKLEPGDLPPVVDIEHHPKKNSEKELKKNLKIFLDILEQRFGQKPILYTYYYYYRDVLGDDFQEYPLWLANYNDVLTPNGDSQWLLWQFTENGIVQGINTKVDVNIYNGSRNSLKRITLP